MKEFKDSITMSIVEFRKYYYALQRVRELHRPYNSGMWGACCFECEVDDMPVSYPCPTIKALDGEQVPTDTQPNITVITYPMLMLSTKRLGMPKSSDGEQE